MASHYFASHRGGIESVAEELFGGLAAREQEVAWIASDATPPPNPAGRSHAVSLRVFNLVEERVGLPFPIPKLGTLREISREVSVAEILILHDCLYLTNILAFLLARFHRVPTIIIQHTSFIPYSLCVLNAGMRFANAIVTKPMLSHAEKVVFISETTGDYFRHLHFRSSPEIIFNGVDIELYRRLGENETKAGLQRQYGLPQDRPVILFVGRFVEKKGMSAMKRMVELHPDWTWAFAGWGPLDPNAWNAANVRVFSNLRGPSMAALYRASDLLVLPSTGEGFPLVVQEALASGLPVVCSQETLGADPAMNAHVRGIPVYSGEDDRTAREFVSAIEELLHAGASSNDRPGERRAFAVSRYSWRTAVERYLQVAVGLVHGAASHSAAAGKSPRRGQ